jgi:hypothetical protein
MLPKTEEKKIIHPAQSLQQFRKKRYILVHT